MLAFRVSFLLSLALFALFAFGLYLMKYEAQAVHRELAQKRQSLAAEQENIKLLKAEWAYLTQPERLQKLQKKHLGLTHISAEKTIGLDGDSPQEYGSASGADGASVQNVGAR